MGTRWGDKGPVTRGPLLPLLLTAALPPGPLAGASGEELASEELASGLPNTCAVSVPSTEPPAPGARPTLHSAFPPVTVPWVGVIYIL